MSKVVILDYGMGNLRSVERKFFHAGADVLVTNDLNIIKNAVKLVLPGVGHFAKGIEKLKQTGIYDVLNEKVLIQKTPILGICLGMQLMARHSQEGDKKGFCWFDADIIKFNIDDKLKFKVPHMGWNNLVMNKESILFNGISKDAMFYFVHSYYIKCNDEKDILSTSEYESPFTSSILKDNIYGTQFHPEKSHSFGEIMLKNFINI